MCPSMGCSHRTKSQTHMEILVFTAVLSQPSQHSGTDSRMEREQERERGLGEKLSPQQTLLKKSHHDIRKEKEDFSRDSAPCQQKLVE